MTRGKIKRLKSPMVLQGKGLHTGVESTLRLYPVDELGIWVEKEGKRYNLQDLEVDGSARGTALLFPDGKSLKTVEHLLAALSGLGVWQVAFSVEGPEVPAMDGSCFPLAKELSGNVEEISLERNLCVDVVFPIWVHDENRKAFVAAFPGEGFQTSVVVNYGTERGITQAFEYVHSEGAFLEEVAKARTFVLEEEIEFVISRGLGLGGSKDNTVVVPLRGPMEGLRYPDELARHKTLDLIGDLSLLGSPVRGIVVSYKGGHALNVELARRLKRLLVRDNVC
jgi:UDP-3-O-[3-hydroxymyristoyl] N-acetylglucosamine deacetylase